MNQTNNSKKYDLEDRTLAFAKRVRNFIKRSPNSLANIEDGKQVIRSSGSVGANYIEANESLSKKDFILRIKICRKEAKETGLLVKTSRYSKRTDGKRAERVNSREYRTHEDIWRDLAEIHIVLKFCIWI